MKLQLLAALVVLVASTLCNGEETDVGYSLRATASVCNLLCLKGYQCDPLAPGGPTCVPVTCEASTACPPGYTCVPEDVVCIRAPCPQFSCAIQDPLGCGKCPVDHECDSLTGDCVPVNCNAPEACAANQRCIPTPVDCIRAPCPQFVCQDPPIDKCVICPLFVPSCKIGCKKCLVVPRTCTKCQFAVCLDPEPCVFCPQVLPKCPAGCVNCVISKQTCDECAKATCLD